MADYSDPGSTLEAALLYRRLGLSVLPVYQKPAGNRKKPIGSWSQWMQQLPTEAEIRDWFSQYGAINLGIIGGAVSGNLACWDVDDPDFSNWLKPKAASLHTWVVESGSGKLHARFYTRDPLLTTVISGLPGAGRLADLKAEGSQAVAPPSLHESGQVYRTIAGRPDQIRMIEDLPAALEQIRQRYLREKVGEQAHVPVAGRTVYQDKTIRPPYVGQAFAQLDLMVQSRALLSKIRRAITDPATAPTIGDWHTADSHSEIDYAVCRELLQAQWGRDQIEAVFASYPIGRACYRNQSRPNHGHGYLVRTLDNAEESLARYEEAKSKDLALNFRILGVKVLQQDMPLYELTVESQGYEALVKVTYDELYSRNLFTKKVGAQLNIMPRFLPEYDNEHWHNAVDLITRLAERELVPLAATHTGQLRRLVLIELKKAGGLLAAPPADETYLALGFKSPQSGALFLRGGQLIARLSLLIHPTPDPNTIWTLLRRMQARQVRVRYPVTGTSESLWRLPLGVLDERI